MLKSYSVIRLSRSCGWKSPSAFCTLMLLASCNGGGSSGGGGVAVENPAPISCPSGFIPVPHNSSVGTTKDFCVMKYEAKDNGGVAVSQAAGNPYVSLTIGDSQTKCTNLGANYDLISNPEWMTIARNAESVSSNFQASVMARGWAAETYYGDPWSNTAVAPSTDSNCLYNTGEDTCASSGDHLYKRTLTLSSGEEIWDLSGNVWEWVDWDSAMAGPQDGPKDCAADWVEFYPVAASYECLSGPENQVLPVTYNGSSVKGFGRFTGGSGGSGGSALRGGDWANGANAGAFALALGNSAADADAYFGFRCVYRPTAVL